MAGGEVDRLFSEFWVWRVGRSPEFATLAGIRGHDHRLEEFTEQRFLEDLSTAKSFHARAADLLAMVEEDGEAGDAEDEDNLQFFMAEVDTYIKGYSQGGFYFPVSYRSGPQIDLEKLVSWTSLSSLGDYQDLLARYGQVSRYMDQVIQVMRAGVARNMTTHHLSMEGVMDQIQHQLDGEVEDSPLYKPFLNLKKQEAISEEDSRELKAEAAMLIKTGVRPAFKMLAEFLRSEYLAACRPLISASSLPGGAFYTGCIRFHTSTDMSAEEIHRLGLQEVGAIEEEMEGVVRELGLNVSLAEFSTSLRNNPDTFFSSGEEMLETYNTTIYGEVLKQLPKLFNKLPNMKLELLEEPNPEGSNARYIAGTADGSRPGRFFVNTAKYASLSRHSVTTLALHEANPGHHLQGAIVMEGDMPDFRKVLEDRAYFQAPSRFPIHTAYVEGWALYSETLGYDMGLYRDPMVRFGHLTAMIFRACRLVVDTGIHALGWTREEAVQYMLDHTSKSKESIEREIKRYITWPGQALGYKVGQLKLSSLRALAEERLGGRFDVRDFHQVVLDSVGPLYMVERKVEQYITNNS